MFEQLVETDYVIFDVETTGLSPQGGDRIIEIAALKLRGKTIVDKFHSFVDPERPISPGAFQVNGISEDMLRGAPKAKEVLPKFLEFIEDGVFVGHNIQFDMGFLTNELELIGYELKNQMKTIDTISLAKEFLPDLKRYPLWNVAKALGVKRSQQHRAMEDVHLTYEVFCHFIRMWENGKTLF